MIFAIAKIMQRNIKQRNEKATHVYSTETRQAR